MEKFSSKTSPSLIQGIENTLNTLMQAVLREREREREGGSGFLCALLIFMLFILRRCRRFQTVVSLFRKRSHDCLSLPPSLTHTQSLAFSSIHPSLFLSFFLSFFLYFSLFLSFLTSFSPSRRASLSLFSLSLSLSLSLSSSSWSNES